MVLIYTDPVERGRVVAMDNTKPSPNRERSSRVGMNRGN